MKRFYKVIITFLILSASISCDTGSDFDRFLESHKMIEKLNLDWELLHQLGYDDHIIYSYGCSVSDTMYWLEFSNIDYNIKFSRLWSIVVKDDTLHRISFYDNLDTCFYFKELYCKDYIFRPKNTETKTFFLGKKKYNEIYNIQESE
ncbi:hypothetical protein [Saccharicrinis aurantiacus]|uniref:hypothetical protein n=1 Tax=Saccharicrinis aurantiacus TaxID=1849719 RepID=UPI00249017F5|nr:hypothetical protein [Saccharicrinis aurantiacus]